MRPACGESIHDAVLVGIGAEIGDVLVRHDGNVQARFVDHPRFQKRDEGAALLRLAVDAPASGECEDKSSRKRKRTAARPERRTWERCIHSSHIRRSHEYPFFQQAPCWRLVWATGFKSGGRQRSFCQPPDRVPRGSRTHFCRLLVLAVVDQVVDHRRIGQRRRVTEIAVLVFSDLAQDSSHDLAGPRFRQAGCELDQIR